jgi:hypothetical protein
MRMIVSREEAQCMEDAHIEGLHDDLPRQFCPLCDDRPLISYPTERQIRERKMAGAE